MYQRVAVAVWLEYTNVDQKIASCVLVIGFALRLFRKRHMMAALAIAFIYSFHLLWHPGLGVPSFHPS